MQETKTTPDQLAGYLEFNALLQSEKPEGPEAALEMVEKQRAALYARSAASRRAAASTCSRTSPT
jgi:hypothetical protein